MNIRKRGIEAYRAAAGRTSGPDDPAESVKPDSVGSGAGPGGAGPGAAGAGKAGALRGRAGRRRGADPGRGAPPAGGAGLFKAGDEQGGYRRAAKFLILLGRDEAADVLRHLSEAEVEGITREIALIDAIGRDEARRVLAEFGRLLEAQGDAPVPGGAEAAHEILQKAFGEETADRVFRKAVPRREHAFSFLQDLEPQQISFILRGESPLVLTVILAYAEPTLSAAILASLGAETQKEVIQRLARTKRISPEVVVKIEETLREKIRHIGKIVSEKIDGTSALVSILRFADPETERRVLDDIRDRDPSLYDELTERLLTPEILMQVEDAGLQAVLRDTSDQDLALFLKGKSDELRQKLLSNISERRRAFVLDEYRRLGAVKRSRVDEVTKAFLERIKRMQEEGTLLVIDEDDPLIE